ncbi:MAG: hypothetical protein U9R44_00345 [Candidatus Omnitrophota bacterium]|nr:hypothetical protein [Candidatus Omnitrophota bacterium]
MEMSKGIKIYGIAVIVYGVYNLIGIGSFKQFSFMFQPLPSPVIAAVYIFTIFYGICGVYCGSKILRLEDWARKMILGLTVVSVISGLFLNRMVMANFRNFLMTEQSRVTPDMAGPVYTYAVVFTALVTIFELSIIYYFSRPGVIRQFRK